MHSVPQLTAPPAARHQGRTTTHVYWSVICVGSLLDANWLPGSVDWHTYVRGPSLGVEHKSKACRTHDTPTCLCVRRTLCMWTQQRTQGPHQACAHCHTHLHHAPCCAAHLDVGTAERHVAHQRHAHSHQPQPGAALEGQLGSGWGRLGGAALALREAGSEVGCVGELRLRVRTQEVS
jgi:hypothetical protein